MERRDSEHAEATDALRHDDAGEARGRARGREGKEASRDGDASGAGAAGELQARARELPYPNSRSASGGDAAAGHVEDRDWGGSDPEHRATNSQ